MFKKLPVKLIVILFCIAFHSLNTQAGVFKPKPGSTVPADSIIAAIERGDSVIIDKCAILGSIMKNGTPNTPDTIRGFVSISNSVLSDSISFKNCYFMEEVTFLGSYFNKDIDFSKTIFSRRVSFAMAVFEIFVNFDSTAFYGFTDFFHSTFNRYTSFEWSAFRGEVAEFSLTTFNKRVSFRNCSFNSFADFWHTSFGDEADFSLAIFDWKVNLNPIEFKEIYISWKQLKGHLIYDPTSNFKLMKVFEEKRQLDDADGVYLFLKDQERMEKHPLIRYPEYWFVYLTCGYGRRPLNTFILSILIVILFAVLFTDSKAIKQIEKDFWHRRRPRAFREIPKSWRKRFYYALYFSLHTFIIGIVSDWHPTDEFLIGDSEKRGIKLFRFRTLSMIEGALGWILVIILIISLERTIGR